MKKLFLLIIVVSFSVSYSYGQQDPQFTQNMYNKLFPNPAVAGANGSICATLLGREQWVGFEGRPQTYLFSIHGPVKLLHGGIGLSIAQDNLAQISDLHLKASYSYHHSFPFGEINGGIGLGMVQKTIGTAWIPPTNLPDAQIPVAGIAQSVFDLDLGVYFSNDKVYAGISSTHVPSATVAEKSAAFRIARHYYLMAGYSMPLTQSIELQPSIFVKSDGAHAQMDLNAIAVYNDLFFGGLTYRFQDAVSIMAGVDYGLSGTGIAGGTLRFGYAYDVTTNKLSSGSTGSHEIVLNYCFNIPKKMKITRHKSVRYL
jgi:type IX secretion system PorP/SprF family membrane protein